MAHEFMASMTIMGISWNNCSFGAHTVGRHLLGMFFTSEQSRWNLDMRNRTYKSPFIIVR